VNNSTQIPENVPWYRVNLEGGFWHDRQETNRERTIPAVYHQTKITGRIDAWKAGEHATHIFWDSDTAKWIEAVGYSVANYPNPEFEQQVDEVVDLMEKAQLADGYANSYFIAVEPEKRWHNLRDQHELYCAGHLIEAAIAYSQTTGKGKILDILCRYADHIDTTFGPNEDQKQGYCGHPELEMALVRLYRATGEERYLKLSQYFVEQRGQQPHYYDIEARERGEDPRSFWAKSYHYCQAHAPVREQKEVIGHSVRACYMYCAVADLALETGDAELAALSKMLWNDLTQRQMYITGGVGSQHTIEGFTHPYDLPNDTAYSETCSAISLVYWAQRMFILDTESRYIDAMERALYNCILSGVSYEGSHFFQCNPLEAYPNISPYSRLDELSFTTHHRRQEWFEVSCCPPNLARLVASVGNYFYSTTPQCLYVQLYNQNRTEVSVGGSVVQIEQQTHYPWDGEIQLSLTMQQPTQFELALRVPGWCRDFQLVVNGVEASTSLERGYVVIDREWQTGDKVRLSLAMPIERMIANPNIREDAGCVAIQRGPIVYCLEEVDNRAGLAHVTLPRASELHYVFDESLFGGVGTISGEALRQDTSQWGDGLYQPASVQQVVQTPFNFRAIPYSFWANREPGEMRVWIRES
jgi:uncharacterized protein